MPTTKTVRSFTSSRKWALLGILIAGCSDPSSSRLEPGAAVTIINPSSDYIMLEGSNDKWPFIPQASDAVVVSDAAPDGPVAKLRPVRIAVKGGEKDGVTGAIRRDYLKPR